MHYLPHGIKDKHTMYARTLWKYIYVRIAYPHIAVCVCVCSYVCACMHLCVCTCTHVCVRACLSWSRLHQQTSLYHPPPYLVTLWQLTLLTQFVRGIPQWLIICQLFKMENIKIPLIDMITKISGHLTRHLQSWLAAPFVFPRQQ